MAKFFHNDRHETGDNYFRVAYNPEGHVLKVTRVILRPGRTKKGRSNCYGIHEITPTTFVSNWFIRGDTTEITEQQFFTAFDFVVDKLACLEK